MTGSRGLGPAALLAAAVAGLGWAPTFAWAALGPPVLVPLLAVLVVDQLTYGRRAACTWRPVLSLLLGAAALVATFVVLDGASAAEIVGGALTGWQRTLDSTLPARPDVAQMAFVPALVLIAGLLGTEWARRGAGAAATLVPALAVLGLGQLFRAATGWQAVAVAVAFGLSGVAVLRADQPSRVSVAGGLVGRAAPLLATVAVAGLAASVATGVGLPGRGPASLQDGRESTRTVTAADPLAQIGGLLVGGDRVAFRARADPPVDRWPLVVLDRFDGVNWATGARFRTMGTALPAPVVSAPLLTAHAEISSVAVDGPWLPSQARLGSADGIHPLVDPATGVLVRAAGDPDHYDLSWSDVQIDAKGLTAAAIDPQPTGAAELTGVPAGVADLARQAVGADAAPTVDAALVLEKWMRDRYQVATGTDIPTGHSTAQLLNFLEKSKRGTSEQFATAYALMARSLGIPVRVVVGFRDDGSGAVHDDDALAWPEIAVSGLGWVPLDPTGGARRSSSGRSGLAAATQAARDELPSPNQLTPQQPGDPPPPDPQPAQPVGIPVWPAGVLVLIAIAAVPTIKVVRRARRRRTAPRDAVAHAWRDTRDCLRDHGFLVPAGSTVRDVAEVAPADMEVLAGCVDAALWSGHDPDPALAGRAWSAADAVRGSLRALPRRRRIAAAFAIGSLRRQPLSQVAPRSG